MSVLYYRNNVLVRVARLEDGCTFASLLRADDARELAASHPGRALGRLLESFIRSSERAFVLERNGRPAALCGVSPDVLLGRRACVWLLTGPEAARMPVSFVRIMRLLLCNALEKYEELYNFTDARYAAALRFARCLGGTFDGRFITRSSVRFLYVTFRRE